MTPTPPQIAAKAPSPLSAGVWGQNNASALCGALLKKEAAE